MLRPLDANPKSIEKLLANFYVVPDFQRGYVWGKKQVERFFLDLAEAHGSDSDGYFLGSVVTYPEEDGRDVIVDGQQRLTTIILLLAALRDRRRELDLSWKPAAIEGLLSHTYMTPDGDTGHRLRLQLTSGDTAKVLGSAVEGNGTSAWSRMPTSKAERRMADAFAQLSEFLLDRFGTLEELSRFQVWFVQQVSVVHIETPDFASALTIFETINDRGVALSAMDLLKNLMFKEADEEQHPTLNEKWELLVKQLVDEGERQPVRFLRYHLVATYDFDKMPATREVFTWVKANRDQLEYGKDPLNFVGRLQSSARHYTNFIAGEDATGQPCQPLKYLSLHRTSVRQHLMLLLAAAGRLSQKDFIRLAEEMERLAFVFAVTKTPWNRLEGWAPKWCQAIRKAETTQHLDEFVAAAIDPEVERLSPLVVSPLRHPDKLGKGLRRYYLARLADRFEVAARSSQIDKFFSPEVQIEHVMPQTAPTEVDEEYRALIEQVGNLTFLLDSENAAASNKPFEEKLPIYANARFEMTRAIAGTMAVGVDTRFSKMARSFPPATKWDEEEITKRTDRLLALAAETWRLPVPFTD